MHSTNLSPSSHETSLRKVALLLTGLDADSANALLSQMDASSAQAARDAVSHLGPVDAAEQAAVIAEFLGGIGSASPKSDADNAAVELDASLARKLASDVSLPSATDEIAVEHARATRDVGDRATPWQRIHATSAHDLAACLAGENPQLVAVILAQLSTTHAADTLHCFPAWVQTDLLGRIARATTPAADLLADIGNWLDQRLTQSGPSVTDRTASRFPAPHPAARRSRTSTAAVLDRLHTNERRPEYPRLDEFVRHDGNSRVHEIDRPDPIETIDAIDRANGVERPGQVTCFAHLIDLDDDRLAGVLRQASPLEVVLAVAGAAPDIARRWLDRLPESERRHMQRTLTNLGPWRLSDATAAQERLVELANRPRSRRATATT